MLWLLHSLIIGTSLWFYMGSYSCVFGWLTYNFYQALFCFGIVLLVNSKWIFSLRYFVWFDTVLKPLFQETGTGSWSVAFSSSWFLTTEFWLWFLSAHVNDTQRTIVIKSESVLILGKHLAMPVVKMLCVNFYWHKSITSSNDKWSSLYSND